MKKISKGEYGYIEYQRRYTLIRTLIYFAICAAIFIIGYVTTGTRKNLLTIVAILGCLPACKSVVNYIMFMRAVGCSKEVYDVISEYASSLYGLYDLFMTSYSENYAISHLVIAGASIVGIAENGADVNKIEKHIEEHLKQDGYKGINVKIFSDVNKYAERLKQINDLSIDPLKTQDSILELLLAISL